MNRFPIFLLAVVTLLFGAYIFINLKDDQPYKGVVVQREVVLDKEPLIASNTTNNLKEFKSRCGYTIKYPDNWKVEEIPPQQDPSTGLTSNNPPTGCETWRPPIRVKPPIPDSYGFWFSISRTKVGYVGVVVNYSTGENTPYTVNSLDDYIQSERMNSGQVSNIQDKTYGKFIGKSYALKFDLSLSTYRDGFEDPEASETVFIFPKDDYIYRISWSNRYHVGLRDNKVIVRTSDDFTKDIDEMISSIGFERS